MGQLAKDSFAGNNKVGIRGDIGSPSIAGSDSLSSGTWTITGAGSDIWNTSDQFHYVSQPVLGDYTMSCQVLTQTNTNGFAKAGLMFRGSSAANDVYYAVEVTPTNGIVVQYRSTVGGGAASAGSTVTYSALPMYIQITRRGNVFTAYTSTDGTAWVMVPNCAETIDAMPQLALVGFAVCSHNTGSAGTVTASSFSPVLVPWTGSVGNVDIGAPALAGSASETSGTWTVVGGGSDIFGTSDQFRFVAQPVLANPGSWSSQDTFSGRTVASNTTGSWGTASDGESWSCSQGTGSPNTFAVSGGEGQLSEASGTGIIIMKLGSNSGTDMEVSCRMAPAVASDSVHVFVRLSDSTHYYRLDMQVGTTTCNLGYKNGGAFTSIATSGNLGFTMTAGSFYWFRLRVIGTTLYGKVWASGSSEPSAWSVTGTDSNVASGGIGCGANPQSSTACQFDTFNAFSIDSVYSCRVASQTNTNSSAKAGLMFRNSFAANDVYYGVYCTPGNVIKVEYRSSSGGSAASAATVSSISVPQYLRIVKAGTTFSASYSSDGITWNTIASSSQTLANANTIMFAGIVVCSHNTGSTSTATFDHMSPDIINGWFQASDGQYWSVQTGVGTLAISGSKGTITGTNANDTHIQIGSKTTIDQEIRVRFSTTGTSPQWGVQARFTNKNGIISTYRLRYNNGNADLIKIVSGSSTTLATTVWTISTGTSYWLLLRCTGTSIQGRFWTDGSTEPTTWNLSATDSSITSGGFSLYDNSSTTVVSFDGFYVQDGFVTRSNANLIYNGSNFYFGGANSWWWNWFTNEFAVMDAMQTCVEMGVNVVRIKSGANSQGFAQSYEPTQNSFTDSNLYFNDWVVWQAGLLGLKLILPFCDYFNNGAGWIGTFATWNGVSTSSFWTNAGCISDYENYINHYVNHVNIYTGIPYKDDSTILAWESMNEPQTSSVGASTLATWTQTISAYTKSVDPNHLFQDGANDVNSSNLTDANTDMYTEHFYPMSVSRLNADITTMTGANKVFYVGEYDWSGLNGGDTLSSFISTIEGNSLVSGDCLWDLTSHKQTYGWGGSSVYDLSYPMWSVPSGNYTDDSANIRALRTHFYKMRTGGAAPADSTPPAPTQFIATMVGNTVQLQWQGVVGAKGYSIERSTTSATSGFVVIFNQVVNDFMPPIIDEYQVGGQVWYRIRAMNYSNSFGSYSYVTTVTEPGVATGQIIYAADYNAVANVLNRSAGQVEFGRYYLGGSSYTNNGTIQAYIAFLSRQATPVSVFVDMLDVTALQINTPPITNHLTTGGVQVYQGSSGAQGAAYVAGNYWIQY